jgi:deoxyribonuclease V
MRLHHKPPPRLRGGGWGWGSCILAKSLLIGEYEELAETKGSWQPLIHKKETIGAVLRTRTGVKPVYISSGHQISLPTAIEMYYTVHPNIAYQKPLALLIN